MEEEVQTPHGPAVDQGTTGKSYGTVGSDYVISWLIMADYMSTSRPA
jgi:hypothetical protein